MTAPNVSLLANLLTYAEQKNLFTPFHRVSVHARLVLGKDIRIEPLDDKATLEVPLIKRTGLQVFPYIGYDNQDYVLGDNFDVFWENMKGIVKASGDRSALTAINAAMADRSWLKSANKVAQKLLENKKSKGAHLMIALAIGDANIADRPDFKAYFEKKLKEEMSTEGPDFCLITGRRCHHERLHDPIKGVPGTGMPVPLVSFQQKTATSDGLRQCANFTTSRYAQKGYTSALNDGVANRKVTVTDNTSIIFWGPDVAVDIAKALNPYTKKEDRDAAWTAIEKTTDSPEQLHILYLKGSQGRIAILGYDIRHTSSVIQNLLFFRQWWGEASMVYRLQSLGPKHGEAFDKGRQIQSLVKIRTIQSLLLGDEVPEVLMRDIFARISPKDAIKKTPEFQCQEDWIFFSEWLKRAHNAVLAGKEPPPCFGGPMSRSSSYADDAEPLVDMMFTSPATDHYKLGRLVALEAALRRQAHGFKVSSDASLLTLGVTNPAAAYAEMSRRTRTYIDKMRRRGIRFTRFSLLAQEVVSSIQHFDAIHQIKPLSTKEKAEFLFGYNHQDSFNDKYTWWRHNHPTTSPEAAE